MGEMVTFKSNGGSASGYLASPASGTGAGVIVIQEWWGLVPHIEDVTDRFAAEGFVALAPDLYHGQKATGPDQAGKLMMALNIDQAEKDLRGAIQFYQKVTSLPGAERKLAAEALYRMAECQQALGNAEARKTYQRIVKDFADQRDVAGRAGDRLMALQPAAGRHAQSFVGRATDRRRSVSI